MSAIQLLEKIGADASIHAKPLTKNELALIASIEDLPFSGNTDKHWCLFFPAEDDKNEEEDKDKKKEEIIPNSIN